MATKKHNPAIDPVVYHQLVDYLHARAREPGVVTVTPCEVAQDTGLTPGVAQTALYRLYERCGWLDDVGMGTYQLVDSPEP